MLKRILGYVFRHKLLLITGIFFVIINAAATLAPGEWFGELFKQLLEKKTFDEMIIFGIIALIIFSVKFVADFFRRFCMTYLSELVGAEMQRDFHNKVIRLPLRFFRKSKVGELISRTTNDVNVIRVFLSQGMMGFVNDPLILIIGLVRLFMLNWIFTLELFGAGILIFILVKLVGDLLRKAARKVQASLGDITSRMQQSLFSVEIIKLFHREKFHAEKFSESVDTFVSNSKRSAKLTAMLRPAVDYAGFLGVLIIVATGTYLISNNQMAVTDLSKFIFYAAIFSAPLNEIAHILVQFRAASAAGERYFEILDTEEEVYDDGGIALPEIRGQVAFEDVCFSYNPGEAVLQGVSFRAEPGQVIALVGTSGGGKTTLVTLLPRLVTPESGRILIDGHDIQHVSLSSLRSQIGMVTQDNILFPGTIRENILYGKLDAVEEEIIEAAKVANAHDFILAFPKGYDTEIGERGLMISGGQRQRLALARAVIRKPKIMILDEATSALDTESEKLVQAALSTIIHRQTTFVIAHRLSTVMEADTILVLDKGRVAESGTHEELVSRKGSMYQKLYEMQFQV